MASKQRIIQPGSSRFARLLGRIKHLVLARIWYVHRPVILLVHASADTCFDMLNTVARPSTRRLQYRNLFVHGRRYHLLRRRGGFRMTTTNARRWRYRKRTSSTAVLWGMFSGLDDDLTRLTLQVRINVGFLLDTFVVPVGMGILLVYVPWPLPVIITCLAVLMLLSWVAHRSQAVLEAREMIWFIQRALDEMAPPDALALEAGDPENVVYAQDAFEDAWEKFYHDHRDDPVT